MVLMVQGSYVSENDATAIASAIAVSSAMDHNHKTLVMQLTDNNSLSALTVLKGKEIAENTITELGTYQIEDKGVDALLRRASSIKLVKETFDSSTEPMLSYENQLDIADITKKNDFGKTLTVAGMKNILKYANDVYSMIIIILDGKNDGIMAEMLELCDAYITCVKQGPAPHAFNTFDGKKSYFAVSEFDTHSKYNLQYLKKIYGNTNVFAIPYNTEFHDAVISGTLLRFMLKNNAPEKEDDNAKLRDAISTLSETVINEKEAANKKELERLEAETFIRDDDEEENELTEVDNFETEVVQVEKRRFLKKVVEEEEVLKIHDDLPPKKQKRFAFFVKKEKANEKILEEKELEVDLDEDNVAEQLDLAVGGEDHSEVVLPKKKEKKKLFGRKKKRVDAAEYDFLDYKEEDAQDETSEVSTDDAVEEDPVLSETVTEEEPVAEEKPKKAPIPIFKRKTVEEPVTKEEIPEVSEEIKEEPVKITDKWTCPDCGTENTGKFCMECGAKKTLEWTCPDCGTVNTGKFCMECGHKRG